LITTSTSPAAIYLMTKIVFFGNERLVSGLASTKAPVLTGLIERNYEIAAIVSHHNDANSRNNRPLEVGTIAKNHNIPLLLPEKPSEIKEELKKINADMAILIAYGKIIPQSIIDLFPKGIINIHPSLLPKYRGPTPIESAILNGDHTTGITIMQLTSGMDNGPVYTQQSISLTGMETKFELYEIIAEKSAGLLFEILPSIIDGTLIPQPQNETDATYSRLLQKSDGLLDTNQLTATEAERRIRAYLGFPKTKIKINDHAVIITKAHTSNQQKTPLDIECSDGAYLSIDELIAPSGKKISADAYLRGYAA